MIDAYDLNDPDPKKRELASVQFVDELFGPGLLDRLAKPASYGYGAHAL